MVSVVCRKPSASLIGSSTHSCVVSAVSSVTAAAVSVNILCLGCCSGLEEVLGTQLPKDLSSDEAQTTLAKLVSHTVKSLKSDQYSHA